ncbi:PAS domain-containing protein [Paeniroseomonas aquatica]|uniref:PAS domain-containing protein n=1 Tax=Paeniroseomonas aquatica TaxID=373043 RepID=UPI00361C4904
MPSEALPIGIEDLRPLAGAMFLALERSGLAMVVAAADAPDLPIVFTNAAFTRLTGYAAAEVAGRNCRLLQGPGTDRTTVARVRLALRAGQPAEAEMLNYRQDGTPSGAT